MKHTILTLLIFCSLTLLAQDKPVIYTNQVAFDINGPKSALVGNGQKLPPHTAFALVDAGNSKPVFTGTLGPAQQITEWRPGQYFYKADFSGFNKAGKYRISVHVGSKTSLSDAFEVKPDALAQSTIQSILHYYRRQRANTPGELAADAKMKLLGTGQTVDIHGGWCDASGDVSKYFSHLAYANFMSPQQIPLVTWSMVYADEAVPKLLTRLGAKDSIESEALWGADYMMRALSKEGYFYMIVFSYFNKDPNARRIVGLHANSVTTNEYQSAFREGGGMAIAALARISRWKKHGDFTSAQYLDAAKRAFAHLLVNNTKYDDDGKENIIDDYCALMAATELWIATSDVQYRTEARKRAEKLSTRLTRTGYFRADDGSRPYWHASDAGLPIIALARFAKQETDEVYRAQALQTIKASLDYELRVTNEVNNPFGYARQTFKYKDKIQDGFFIPHENETGWWWQGENARLGSLAAAAIVGGRMAYPANNAWKVKPALAAFATDQLNWILGSNPYQMCFMYNFGSKNVPYMHSNFGHGSERGGISNGITGGDGKADGSDIDFKTEAQGNEWRWTEQWIPHAAWFLQAIAAMAEEK
ncbi:glycoside hydrolase family 9 protein [Mucilaginibacter mali]|uniref:Glycoside hydrolase family 9 protein n=1 Tax=Mucilaginibacter mali TaxID=2740462 RepID=A0A7D4UNK0_9SPHI|nr:glycoside hydrolase family 9 protein [Mucilaginibacter mali]QKJ32061.1 glycoside hydrolase family 9 protein [Mucilaginibacter mali]